MATTSFRDQLRLLPAPADTLPVFDTDAAPADPISLFREWFDDVVAVGIAGANAMTLSTASADSTPNARTLLLKDVTPEGFWFASLSSGPKGRELAENPRAALTLYWKERGRQVRISGRVATAAREDSEQDFRARHPFSRAQAMAGDQSEAMPTSDEVEKRMSDAQQVIEENPDYVPADWSAYIVTPTAVDFWQAAVGHDQIRLQYRMTDGGWVHERVWP